MATSEPYGFGASVSADGATRFQSILFTGSRAGTEIGRLEEPDYFADLNLDQVLASMTAGREQYELGPFFYASLHEAATVRYRHEVLRDLEKPDVRASIDAFAERMRRMREHLVRVDRLHYELQKQTWFLDAVKIYCGAVRGLCEELAAREVTSRGMDGFRGYLVGYLASEGFAALEAETRSLKEALARIRYSLRIQGPKVTVSRYEGEADYRPRSSGPSPSSSRGAATSYLVDLPEPVEMNHVEAQIAERVAWLHPEVFRTLADYCSRHRDYLDETVGRFDREVQFYLAYLDLIGRLRAADLPLCYPQVSTSPSRPATAKTPTDVSSVPPRPSRPPPMRAGDLP